MKRLQRCRVDIARVKTSRGRKLLCEWSEPQRLARKAKKRYKSERLRLLTLLLMIECFNRDVRLPSKALLCPRSSRPRLRDLFNGYALRKQQLDERRAQAITNK